MFIVNEEHTICVRLNSFSTCKKYIDEDINEATHIYNEVNNITMNGKEDAKKVYNEYLPNKEPIVYLKVNDSFTVFAVMPKSKADKVIERLLYAIRMQCNLFDLREEIENA